jgi:hypothetical protein
VVELVAALLAGAFAVGKIGATAGTVRTGALSVL